MRGWISCALAGGALIGCGVEAAAAERARCTLEHAVEGPMVVLRGLIETHQPTSGIYRLRVDTRSASGVSAQSRSASFSARADAAFAVEGPTVHLDGDGRMEASLSFESGGVQRSCSLVVLATPP